jgi:hypothetical protein
MSTRKRYVPSTRHFTFNGLHGVIYQITKFIVTTAQKTLNYILNG